MQPTINDNTLDIEFVIGEETKIFLWDKIFRQPNTYELVELQNSISLHYKQEAEGMVPEGVSNWMT